ncbi:sensor domain-containing diguanylate cyclase [Bacillus sp. A301a_S52]|nr:sensor domain-containing diguanylate cyclase [Bacillus sp. A301a_S52]
MSERKQLSLWITWLLIVPPFIYYIIENTLPLWQTSGLAILSFTALIMVASLFPIQIRYTSVIPFHGISLAIFLHFGLLIEILVTQIAILTTLFKLKISTDDVYRIPINGLIFIATSLGSASLFYLAGGTTGHFTVGMMIEMSVPILVYTFTFFVLNNLLLYLCHYYLFDMREVSFFDEAFKWQAISCLLIVLVGLALAMLYEEVGYIAVLITGIPIVSVFLILKIYNEDKKTTELLKQVSSFGHEVNDSLEVNTIIELFISTCSKIFPTQSILLFEQEDYNRLRPIYMSQSFDKDDLSEGDGVSKHVLQTGGSVLFTSRKQWEHLDSENVLLGNQSIMAAPCVRNHNIVAVITLTNQRKNVFQKSDQKVLEIIANYLSVAVQNARYIAQTKKDSECCGLTGLYNFNYFKKVLSDYEKLDTSYAIVIIDLDHFKSVNDTYGHQSGNDVLIQVAEILTQTIKDDGIVGRYGGEEFVILLDNAKLFEAFDVGERVRRAIEAKFFIVSDDLLKGEKKLINITASIGVATKLSEEDTPIEVLRNADRAMYTGAKQKGRNKVAQYS